MTLDSLLSMNLAPKVVEAKSLTLMRHVEVNPAAASLEDVDD